MPEYECDCCGACCQGHLIVEADQIDVRREPRLIQSDPHYAGRSVRDALQELSEVGKCVVLAANRPCTFLSTDCRCSIYPTRPDACIAMDPGDQQCQEARAAQGLPPLEPIIRADDSNVAGDIDTP